MADDRSSVIVSQLISGLSHVMPPDERAKLAPYEQAAAEAGSEKTAEWRRAYRCAKWAEQIVSLPEHRHLVAEAKKAIEVVKEVEKTVGAEIGDLLEVPFASIGHPVSPRFEAEITWVYEAVHVAEEVAGRLGWEAVPWEELLREVLAVRAD